MLHAHVTGLPIYSCSAVNAAFLKIPLIFPSEPNSPKNAADKAAKMQQDYDFCRKFAKNNA